MKIIIQASGKYPERLLNAEFIKNQVKEAEIYINDSVNNFKGFLEIMELSKYDDLLFIEDDAKLCVNFENIAFDFISKNKDSVIQFMDLKRKNINTSIMTPSTFCMSVCVYIPKIFINAILEQVDNYNKDVPQHPKAHDYLIGYTLKKLKKKYLMHRPCLVQHLGFRSVAHPGASMGRQTNFFIDDYEDSIFERY